VAQLAWTNPVAVYGVPSRPADFYLEDDALRRVKPVDFVRDAFGPQGRQDPETGSLSRVGGVLESAESPRNIEQCHTTPPTVDVARTKSQD
jgi:hypothetical protein